MDSFIREWKLAMKDRVVLVSFFVVTLLSSYSLIVGLNESVSELTMIERVEKQVNQDREYNLAKQSDAGSAAYYVFHFTYDPPSSLAFVSRGVRDELPWKHRIRMLALEGQIYETDAGNPQLSGLGKLDFAFVAAFLLPLFFIILLYDLRAVEIRNNRWHFLAATSGDGRQLLMTRLVLRSFLLLSALILPFIVAATYSGVSLMQMMLVIAAVLVNTLIWSVLGFFVINRIESGPTTAAVLLGSWFLFAIAIPVGGKHMVEQLIEVPRGGELLLTQRETVNDAWDLPKEATMLPFLERHPQWTNTPPITKQFEWRWYYAFQQVGDQTVEPISKALSEGIVKRDTAMGLVALASPSLLTQRLISQTANTDIKSFQRYDKCVRSFHQSLREFHYPMMFGNVEYSLEHMTGLPSFKPCIN